MSDEPCDMDLSERVSPIVTVESTRRGRDGEVTETFGLEAHEVERLLELALRDSLDNVDARVIAAEIRARSFEE